MTASNFCLQAALPAARAIQEGGQRPRGVRVRTRAPQRHADGEPAGLLCRASWRGWRRAARHLSPWLSEGHSAVARTRREPAFEGPREVFLSQEECVATLKAGHEAMPVEMTGASRAAILRMCYSLAVLSAGPGRVLAIRVRKNPHLRCVIPDSPLRSASSHARCACVLRRGLPRRIK